MRCWQVCSPAWVSSGRPTHSCNTTYRLGRELAVRLPSADYERLRDWSREHGFSMAVIIRTLVERFIRDQQRRGPGQNPASAPG